MNYKKINLDNYTFTKPEKEKDGTFMTYLVQKNKPTDKTGLYVQTPTLIVQEPSYTKNNNNYVDMVVRKEDKSFFNFVMELESLVLETTHNSCESWFNKQLSMEVLEKMLNPIFTDNKRLNAPMITGLLDNKVVIFDENKKKMSLEKVLNCYVVATLHFVGFKFLERSFETCYTVVQLDVLQNLNTTKKTNKTNKPSIKEPLPKKNLNKTKNVLPKKQVRNFEEDLTCIVPFETLSDVHSAISDDMSLSDISSLDSEDSSSFSSDDGSMYSDDYYNTYENRNRQSYRQTNKQEYQTRQPTRQSTRQPTRQSTRQPTRQPTRQSTRKSTRKLTRQPTRQSARQPTRQSYNVNDTEITSLTDLKQRREELRNLMRYADGAEEFANEKRLYVIRELEKLKNKEKIFLSM